MHYHIFIYGMDVEAVYQDNGPIMAKSEASVRFGAVAQAFRLERMHHVEGRVQPYRPFTFDEYPLFPKLGRTGRPVGFEKSERGRWLVTIEGCNNVPCPLRFVPAWKVGYLGENTKDRQEAQKAWTRLRELGFTATIRNSGPHHDVRTEVPVDAGAGS